MRPLARRLDAEMAALPAASLAEDFALPRDWTPVQVFFAITVILSLRSEARRNTRSPRMIGRASGRLLICARVYRPAEEDPHTRWQPHAPPQ